MKQEEMGTKCPRCGHEWAKPDWRCPECYYEFGSETAMSTPSSDTSTGKQPVGAERKHQQGGIQMTNAKGNQSVEQPNHIATAGLVCSVISLMILGQTPPNHPKTPYLVVGSLVGILALSLSIFGLVKARTLHKGKVVAIIGIVLGAFWLAQLCAEKIMLPLIASSRESARQNVVENAIRQSGARTFSLSPQDSIHYSGGATESDARNVGSEMTELQLLTGGKRHDILLSKDSAGLNVSLVIPSAGLVDDKSRAALPQIANALATKLGGPVRLRVVDFNLKELVSVQAPQ